MDILLSFLLAFVCVVGGGGNGDAIRPCLDFVLKSK